MKVLNIHLNGPSPKVSGFLNDFDDRDVIIDILKDSSKGNMEEYEVEIKYNEMKVKDALSLIKKSLPDQVSLTESKSQAGYSDYNDDLDRLRKSIPNIVSYDYFIDLEDVLGSEVLHALNDADNVDIVSDSNLVNSFITLMRGIFEKSPKYDSFTPKNRRDVSDLYTRACQESTKLERRVMTVYKIAFDAVYSSVQRSKVTLSVKTQSEFGLNLARLVSQNNFDDNDKLKSYIKKKLETRVSEIDSGQYDLEHRLTEFPNSKKFIDEVIKIFDDVSSKSHERITSLYLDALRESSGISKPIEEYVDISWDSYKSFINAKEKED